MNEYDKRLSLKLMIERVIGGDEGKSAWYDIKESGCTEAWIKSAELVLKKIQDKNPECKKQINDRLLKIRNAKSIEDVVEELAIVGIAVSSNIFLLQK